MPWKLTRDAFGEFKHSYDVYRHELAEDRYGNEALTYPSEPSFSITCMWEPYGDDIQDTEGGAVTGEILEAVVYDEPSPSEHDRVVVDGVKYVCIAAFRFQNYTLVRVRKLKTEEART